MRAVVMDPGSEAGTGREGGTLNDVVSFLKRLLRLRPVLVVGHKTRARGFARMTHPDLAVRMQAAAAGGGNGSEPGAMQQSCVGDAAIRVDAAVGSDLLLPDRLALRENGGIGQRR